MAVKIIKKQVAPGKVQKPDLKRLEQARAEFLARKQAREQQEE